MAKGKSIISGIYSGTSDIGKASATIGLIVAGVIGLILFIVGITIVVNAHKWAKVQAKTAGPSTGQTDLPSIFMNKVAVNYKYKGKDYSGVSVGTNNDYDAAGKDITIYVKKSDPNTAETDAMGAGVGYALMLGALALVGFGYMSYYFSHKYKAVGALEGVGFISSFFRR